MRLPSRVAVLAVFVIVLAAAAPAAARVDRPSAIDFIGPYTGVGTGVLDRTRHIDNHAADPANHIVTDSREVYRARFRYSFRIDGFGTITGTGNGSYQPATYHLEGTNGSQGPFSCDIPMTTTEFSVRVTGQAADGRMHVRFALEGAREANEEMLCGANYYGFATDDTRLADSLELLQPPEGLDVDQAEPTIAPLRKVETLGDEFDSRVNTHEWSFTIKAPPTTQDVGRDATPGTSTTPERAGRGGAICTVAGTAGADRLVGTPGNDVLCGYGGADTIDGRGGNDLVYGGPGDDRVTGGPGLDVLYGNAGRDSLNARDGKRDRVDGGADRDTARVDRGRDLVQAVERVG